MYFLIKHCAIKVYANVDYNSDSKYLGSIQTSFLPSCYPCETEVHFSLLFRVAYRNNTFYKNI